MYRSGQLTVYLHFGIRHRSFENNKNPFLLPLLGNHKFVTIDAFFIGFVFIVAVIVGAESLQLPVGGHGNCRPFIRPATAGDHKFPVHGRVAALAGEVKDFRFAAGMDACCKKQDSKK